MAAPKNGGGNDSGIPEYWFMPPFFTLQVIEKTKQTQFEMWIDLIAFWLKQEKKTAIYVNKDSQNFPFTNKQINRALKVDDIRALLDFMATQKYGSWNDDERTIFSVSWKSMNAWATMIYEWAVNQGQIKKILTLYDIHSGDITAGAEFHGLDSGLILKILDVLEDEGKCQVFKDGAVVDEYGVKFYET
mmetsp:Transcript_51856/g.85860  ORF Transcript_51856/g.85860 Transcript_51856/m.85860 type:complete len:189 (+) Transcript_51856:46-612(+)